MPNLTVSFIEAATGLNYRSPNFLDTILHGRKFEKVREAFKLPDVDELPKKVRDFVKDVSNIHNNVEKFGMIHNFVQANMRYSTGNDVFTPIEDLLNDFSYGDCEDHARVVGALSVYAGMKPESVHYLAGSFKYDGYQKDFPKHAVLLLEEQGRFFVSDLNIEEIAELGPDGSSINTVNLVLADTEEVVSTNIGFSLRTIEGMSDMNGNYMGADKCKQAKTNNDLPVSSRTAALSPSQ